MHRRVAHIIPTAAAAGAKTHEPFRTPYFISCGTHARRDVRAPPGGEKNIAKPFAAIYIVIIVVIMLYRYYRAEHDFLTAAVT